MANSDAEHRPPQDSANEEITGQREQAADPTSRVRDALQEKRASLDDYEAERDLWEGGFSAKAMFGTWLAAIVLAIAAIVGSALIGGIGIVVGIIGAVVILLIVGLIYAYRRLNVHYKLTSQRFIHQTGVLSRVTDRIEVIDIDDVAYAQGPVQRMLGVGSIKIDSSDKSHPELTMLGIDNVQEVAGLIDDIRRSERRRRSLHIESI